MPGCISIVSFVTGEKSAWWYKTHPDYYFFVKSPEKNWTKRLWQLEKYELVQNMKAKRLWALLTLDKENVSTVEVCEKFVQSGT